ncbi:transposase [Paeniglutamicibacter gangotriensis]|nr:transposase [Paeniglutamicibacter gangotriensis]
MYWMLRSSRAWKGSTDPDYEAKARRVNELYDLADGKSIPGEGDPEIVLCFDEFGPLNLQPHPGHQWAPAATGIGDQDSPRRRRRRATYKRPHGVRHLLAAYDLSTDKLYAHVKPHKRRTEFLAFMRYLRTLHPTTQRIAIIMDNYGPHLSTRIDARVGDWAAASNVELAYVPFDSSWLNRIEPQFTALRYFALNGTDHPSHKAQGSMICRFIIWRNHHTTDPKLRKVIRRASIVKRAKVA